MHLKRTKIVCTLGPSTDGENVLREMIQSGMNLARLNLSHGTLDEHLGRMKVLRDISQEIGEHVGVMFDTRGPDVRVRKIPGGKVMLNEGDIFVLTGGNIPTVEISPSGEDSGPGGNTGGSEKFAKVTEPTLIDHLEVGHYVYLDDGLLMLKVESIDGTMARCRVISGGILKSNKGINVPGIHIGLPVLSSQDVSDLRAGIENGMDFVSASFVSSGKDVASIRDSIGDYSVPVIAKIENSRGLANLDSIIEAADGVMVARGDLGIEIPMENVPGVQKRIIRLCREVGKPVITATQMLESMTHSTRPTRAEITDVANAVLDGTSAVMLSGETAAGEYPVESVKVMSRICGRAETDLPPMPLKLESIRKLGEGQSIRVGIAHAACDLASVVDAPVIICVTDSGTTAAIFSHFRRSQSILACATDEKVARRLALSWGVIPIIVDTQDTVEAVLESAIEEGKSRGLIESGDNVVFTGNLSGRGGETNLLATVVVE